MDDPDLRSDPASKPALGARPPVEKEPPDDEEMRVPGSFLASLPQFFVFPLILVATLTVVYLVLRMLAGSEPDSARELLVQLEQAGEHSRWQVAQRLADGLGRGRLDLAEVSAAELARLYERYGEGEGAMKRYLLGVLAFKQDPALTAAAMVALQDGDPAVREAALAALSRMGDPAAVPALVRHLEHEVREERWLALGALANLGTPGALDAVAGRVGGPDVLEHRNAVLALAARGDGRAMPWLADLLKRESYVGDDGAPRKAGTAGGEDGVVEAFLVNACRAAAVLNQPALRAPLQELREADPSTKVRSAAINALHEMQAASEQP